MSDQEVISPLFLESFFSEKEERLQRRANEIDVEAGHNSTESEFGEGTDRSTVDYTVLTPAQQRQRIQEIEEDSPVDAATRLSLYAMCLIFFFVLFENFYIIIMRFLL